MGLGGPSLKYMAHPEPTIMYSGLGPMSFPLLYQETPIITLMEGL